MTVRTERQIEVIGHVFAREVGYDPNTVELQTSRPDFFGHPAGLHFHGGTALRTQETLLRDRPGDVIDGTPPPRRDAAFRWQGQRRKVSSAGGNGRPHDYVADLEFRCQGSTEAVLTTTSAS